MNKPFIKIHYKLSKKEDELIMKDYLYSELYEIESKHWWFVVKKKIVLSMMKKYLRKKNNKILDAGCGCGLMLNDLKEYGQPFGMDYSDEAVKFSKLIFNGEINIGYIPGNIPYDKNYFNCILALDVIEHIDDDIGALKDIYEHLSDNGICIITVPAYMFLWSNHDDIHEHKRRYVLCELKHKLINSGFKIEKISYYNTLLFLPIFIARQIHKLFNIKGSDAKMPNKLINVILERIFMLEEHILNNFNMKFGVSVIAVVRRIS